MSEARPLFLSAGFILEEGLDMEALWRVVQSIEMLGLDPLYVANEGKFIAFVAEKDARRAVHILKQHPGEREACIIGQVKDTDKGIVTMKTKIGTTRIVDMLSGEQLPRIC